MFGGLFGGYGPYGGGGGGRFEASYRCYPVSFIDKPEAERGDKIFLPPSALDRLAQLHIENPMLFQVENRHDGRTTHCGVLEFIADEGMVYLPYWMMQGTFVRLQPHSKDFLDISNPRAVLETTLRSFSCLSVGDTIPINYNNKKYFIDIVEAKPQPAISVIETDCQVDFAPPLDYVEPEPQFPSRQQGGGGGEAGPSAAANGAAPAAAAAQQQEGGSEPEATTFLAFAGAGRRLDGKPASTSAPVAIPLAGARRATSSAASSEAGSAPSSAPKAGSAPKRPGKVMYGNRLQQKLAESKQGGAGGAGAAPPKPLPPPPKEEEKKEEDGKGFKAFGGKGYSLKG
eukprot:scaffold3.g6719.t1